MGKIKLCNKCNRELPATTECFHRNKTKKDGLQSICKECKSKENRAYNQANQENISKQSRKYYEENKDKISEYHKIYYEENKSEINKQHKEYYQNNRETILENTKEYYENNKEHIKEYKKEYYEMNKKKVSQYHKEYYQENRKAVLKRVTRYRIENEDIIKEKKRIYNIENPGNNKIRAQRYRTKKRNLPATLAEQQWKQIKEDFNNECAYCGKTKNQQIEKYGEDLHQEHFIPLSKGGGYTHNNIIPSCKGCNCSKNDKDFFEWYPGQEFYNKEREKKILKHLNYKDKNNQQLSIL